MAKKDFEKVLELAPENKAAKNQITICNQKIKMQNEKEKRLYKNMFDTILKENRDKVRIWAKHRLVWGQRSVIIVSQGRLLEGLIKGVVEWLRHIPVFDI